YGITVKCDPAVMSTDALCTTTYKFTPDEAFSARRSSELVTITDAIVPVFDAIDPLCLDANASVLPLTSNNGITGKWDPAVVSTDAVGTTTYTFTPDEGQCAGPVTLDVTITDAIVPVFDAIDPLCLNAERSEVRRVGNDGSTGKWDPAVVSTDAVGTTTYTFTPDEGRWAGQ